MLAVGQLGLAGRGFDADHLLAMVGRPPHPALIASVFASAQRSGAVEAVGCRVAADGRLVRVWWGRPDSAQTRRKGPA